MSRMRAAFAGAAGLVALALASPAAGATVGAATNAGHGVIHVVEWLQHRGRLSASDHRDDVHHGERGVDGAHRDTAHHRAS
jgi:hypothetical protein